MKKRVLVIALSAGLATSAPVPLKAGGILVWDELSWVQDLLNFIKDAAIQLDQYTTELRQLQHDLAEAVGINDIYRIKQQIDDIRYQSNNVYYKLLGLSTASGFDRLLDAYYWENYHAPPDPAARRSMLERILRGEDVRALDTVYEPYQKAFEREKTMLEHRAQMMDQARRRMEEINEIAGHALGDSEQTEKQALQVGNAQNQLMLEQGEHLAEQLDTLISTQREQERREMERKRLALDEDLRKREEDTQVQIDYHIGGGH